MWQARKLSPAAHLHRGEIDLSLLGSEQASANPVCMLARANGCLCAYVQWWCIVLLSQSIWQVTAIRPTSHSETPVHRQRGKLWVSFQACERTTSPKSAHIDHIQACLHSCKASPRAREMVSSGSDLPVLGDLGEIPLDRFFSPCFRSFPAHFTHWQAALCFRWEGERVRAGTAVEH